jgi:hypothetical protein
LKKKSGENFHCTWKKISRFWPIQKLGIPQGKNDEKIKIPIDTKAGNSMSKREEKTKIPIHTKAGNSIDEKKIQIWNSIQPRAGRAGNPHA